ncbi:hypothetical protein EVAR_59063_1 [Eumeta japonica]|uniref:Uncharacterized protein n=1 Tax=Eumeta variegata TaxID=151549 RepID=A0A4C1YDW0_EUMVA|nr:hypothetical protein EVAR_59063_1 [Eumeta japonica]
MWQKHTASAPSQLVKISDAAECGRLYSPSGARGAAGCAAQVSRVHKLVGAGRPEPADVRPRAATIKTFPLYPK